MLKNRYRHLKQDDVIKYKQIIMEFLEDYRKEVGLSLSLVVEIAELALQEGRVGIALTSYNQALDSDRESTAAN